MCINGCNNEVYYNHPGEQKGIWCSIHRKNYMINVKNRICLGDKDCYKQPSFNYPDRSHGIMCITHKLPLLQL